MARRTTEPDAEVNEATSTDETVATSSEGESAPAADAASTTTSRPAVPEGYITPIGFAKLLSKPESEGGRGVSPEVKPQMIYSYINQYAGKPNAFPTHSEGGRNNLIVPSEGLAWWDAKEARKVERNKNSAEKKAKAAAKAEKAAAAEAEGADEPAGDFVEAE